MGYVYKVFGEILKALIHIDLSWTTQGACRTCIDTQSAVAAQCKIGRLWSGLQLEIPVGEVDGQIGQQLTDNKV